MYLAEIDTGAIPRRPSESPLGLEMAIPRDVGVRWNGWNSDDIQRPPPQLNSGGAVGGIQGQ